MSGGTHGLRPRVRTLPSLRRSVAMVWRTLRSMRTALILLLILALAVGGGLVHAAVPELTAAGRAASGRAPAALGAFFGARGLFDVFGSWWFALISTLLFVSLGACLIPRTRGDRAGHPAAAAAGPRARLLPALRRVAGARAARAGRRRRHEGAAAQVVPGQSPAGRRRSPPRRDSRASSAACCSTGRSSWSWSGSCSARGPASRAAPRSPRGSPGSTRRELRRQDPHGPLLRRATTPAPRSAVATSRTPTAERDPDGLRVAGAAHDGDGATPHGPRLRLNDPGRSTACGSSSSGSAGRP